MSVTECSYFFCLWAVVCTGYLRRDEGLPNESVLHSFSSAISSCYLHLGFLLPVRMNGMPYVSKIVFKFNSNCTSRVSIALHESTDFTVRSFCWRAVSLLPESFKYTWTPLQVVRCSHIFVIKGKTPFK